MPFFQIIIGVNVLMSVLCPCLCVHASEY